MALYWRRYDMSLIGCQVKFKKQGLIVINYDMSVAHNITNHGEVKIFTFKNYPLRTEYIRIWILIRMEKKDWKEATQSKYV